MNLDLTNFPDYFVGHAEVALEEPNLRLSIPTTWRQSLVGAKAYVLAACAEEFRYLMMFSEGNFAAVVKQADQMTSPLVLRSAQEVKVDRQGRITLPGIREVVGEGSSMAGIVGAGTHLEICSADFFDVLTFDDPRLVHRELGSRV